MFPDIFILKMI